MQIYSRQLNMWWKDDITIEKSEWMWEEAEAHPHVERSLDKKQ